MVKIQTFYFIIVTKAPAESGGTIFNRRYCLPNVLKNYFREIRIFFSRLVKKTPANPLILFCNFLLNVIIGRIEISIVNMYINFNTVFSFPFLSKINLARNVDFAAVSDINDSETILYRLPAKRSNLKSIARL